MYHRQQFNTMYSLAVMLVIAGGINWGLTGLFHFDVIAFIFGPMTIITRLIYSLIGVSSFYVLYTNATIRDIAEPRLA
jgi:uncharacterized membrane protein YuzA (DUF378 family)